jgi:transcriptional regulator with XRE-family HTH domain
MSMRKKTAEKLTDQLRRVVIDSGKTLGQITRDTGIAKSALSRFLSGERGVSAHVLDRLGEYFGLRIVVDEPRAKKGS